MAKEKRQTVLVAGAVLVVCFMVFCFVTTIQGSQNSYEVKPPITISEQRSDAARAIDAYERVMDRFMNITQSNLSGIGTDVHNISERLVVIERKISELSEKMDSIAEKLLHEGKEKFVDESQDSNDSEVDKKTLPWD